MKLFNSRIRLATIIVAVIMATATLFSAFLYSLNQPNYLGALETITIAVPPLEQNALFYVADDAGFFAENGLKVIIRNYDSGATAINGMLNGEADFAETAEFPFVRALYQGKLVTIIACNDQFENDYLVALKTHGIQSISDLKGKTIGVAKGTIAEFFLGRFLDLNDLNLRDVNVVDVRPAEFISSIASGSLDALVAWEPYVTQIEHQVSGAIMEWRVQSSQNVYGLLVSTLDNIARHPGTTENLLRALKQAENYIISNPNQAKAAVKKALNYSDTFVESIWSKHNFMLALDQSLIVAMKDEAQWMINNKIINATQIPDVASYIYTDGLRMVAPDRVTNIT